jgi:hypothetical protein
MRALTMPAVLASALTACTGTVSDAPLDRGSPVPRPGEPAPPVFSCDESAEPDELPLPRLSRAQLENTLRFAVERALPAQAEAIWEEASPVFARYPADQIAPAPGDLKGGYARLDQSIQQTQIDAMFATGEHLAGALTASPDRLAAMMGGCATDDSTSNDRACLEDFIEAWGARVMRAPLASDDVAFYADIAGDTPVAREAVADVINAILNAPQTLYRVEHGTDDSDAVSALSAFELASRLSYAFVDAPPDDALWALAEDGSLLDPAVYRGEIVRLVASAEARDTFSEFVAAWLRLGELPPLDSLNDDPAFVAFAGDDLPPASARAAMIDDVGSSFSHTLGAGGSVSDFLADRRSYARDEFLAGIYDTSRWDGASPPPMFSSPNRAGLLTRAAMLSTGTATTRPIHKGYVVRNAILCEQVGAPPPDVNTNPPDPSGTSTTREAVAELTSGGLCGSCHTTRINPPGFITERFDALGRERMEERIFDAEGNLVASLPIDTTAVPEVLPGDPREMESAAELTTAIDESGLFHSCFVRHYFRFARARVESERDGCLLSELETIARSGAPLSEVLIAMAEARTFKTRRFE